MCGKRVIVKMVFLMVLLFTPFLVSAEGGAKDLTASLALLPGLIDSADKGPFVDLVKAIDSVYTGGKIKIETYPFARSVDNVVKGKADFHIPTIRNRALSETSLPYRFTTEKIGSVAIVIYSNAEKPVTKKMITDALAKKGKFPYTVELPPGIESLFGIPGTASVDLMSSLQKIEKKRLDALVWAQEEVDAAIKHAKIKTIQREHWADYEDSIIITKGPQGDATDKILSDALKKLRSTKQLQALYSKVHRPYSDWQPAKMGW
jgi:polar amino acid transport system substrate-binding protein